MTSEGLRRFFKIHFPDAIFEQPEETAVERDEPVALGGVADRALARREAGEGRGGNAVGAAQFLGEELGAFQPGGGVDSMARVFAEAARPLFPQPFVAGSDGIWRRLDDCLPPGPRLVLCLPQAGRFADLGLRAGRQTLEEGRGQLEDLIAQEPLRFELPPLQQLSAWRGDSAEWMREAFEIIGDAQQAARVKVVVASVMQPTVEYSRQANASL